MGVTTDRCKSDITVESIFTLEHHNAVSIIFLVDVLRASFQLRSRRVLFLPLRRHGLFLWTVPRRFRMCAAPSSHETQLLHSRSRFWVHALHLLFRSLVWYHTCLEVDRQSNRNVKPERPNFKYTLHSSGTSEAQDMAGRTARVENVVARLALVRRSAAEGTSAWNLRARSHVRATPSKDLDRDRRQRENWELKDDGRPDDPESKRELL